MIIAPKSSSVVHQLAHPPDRRLETNEHGLADQKVTDVELHQLRDRGDTTDIAEVEPVAGMALETDIGSMSGRRDQSLQLVR